MPTTDRIERFLDAIEKKDKDELLGTIQELQVSDLAVLSDVVSVIRKDLDPMITVEIVRSGELLKSYRNGNFVEEVEGELSKEEQKELSDKYGERAKTPSKGFIKYEGPQQLLDMILKNKEKKGWKFKDEQ